MVAGRRRPAREFARYNWPGRISTRAVVWLFIFGAGALALGAKLASQGPTCGNVQMRPGDRCRINGSTASYGDMSSSPAPWIFVIIALVLFGYAIARLIRRRPPTPQEVKDFNTAAAAARRHLITKHHQLAAQKIASAEDLPGRLARFDQDVAAERERAGPRKTR
ncbi:hypothetical protein AB0E69_25715 [Kribbella sp. NPDC026611]|uniref:hypothetical protein n=1 Tax=Kribbella sp. NPDC026611 TaxID=3154911 RepID=UPI003411591E